MAIEVNPASGGVEVVVAPGGIVSGGVIVTPGGGGGGGASDWDDITGKPSTFPPDLTDHLAALDPHTGYQKESEKGNPGGYATLDGSGLVPDNQIPTGIARNTEVDGAIDDHEALTNPHPIYLTQAEADALYKALGYVPAWTEITGKPSTFAPIIGSGAADAVAGNDTRLTNARTPTSHAATHTNGADDIQAATSAQKGLATAAQITKLDGIESGATADQTAAEVPFSPAGTIASTNVQGAIEEAASEAAAGTNYRTLVTLGSDVAISTTTLADVTGLSFSVTSGVTYRFFFTIIFDAALSSTGSVFTLNGPASPTLFGYCARWAASSTAQNVHYRNAYEQTGTSANSAATSGNIATVEGIIKPSTTGTLILRAASEVAASAITVKAGSTCEYW